MSINGVVDLASRVIELEVQLQGTMMLLGVCVRRLGGTVTVQPQEMSDIRAYTMIRDDSPADAFIKLYVRPTTEEDDDDGEEG